MNGPILAFTAGEMSGRRAAKTVLVADSDPCHRELVASLLAGEGYSVVLAATGEAALQRIEQGGVDLLVSALVMPGMDGFELLRELRTTAAAPPVIAVVPGMTEMDAVYLKGASLLGAARTYAQPLTPSVFLRSVGELLAIPAG